MKVKWKAALAAMILALLWTIPALADGLDLPDTLTIGVGQSYSVWEQLHHTPDIVSANPAAVAVQDQGQIFGKKEGSSLVTVTLGDDTVQTLVTVKKVTVKIKTASKAVYMGQTLKLTAELFPAGSTGKVTWTSGNTAVAKVNSNGVVTPVRAGTAAIRATLPNGSYASVIVAVKNASVKLNKASASIYEGKSVSLYATVTPAEMRDALSFSTSNKKVAVVNQSGVVTAVAPGTATITAKLKGGAKATCAVTVKPATVKFNKASASVYEGKTLALSASVTPADGANTQISFSSSNKKVATVDQSGVVTAVAPGTATITAKLKSGTKATCSVTVKAAVVKLNRASASVYEGKTLTLSATVTPADGANTQVSFSTSNKKVAVVDHSGVVTAMAPGTATITAKLKSGTKATCAVTVKAATVRLNRASASVYEGKSLTLLATVTPADGANSHVTFFSSNKKVATVDQNGLVTTLSPGTATITAKLKNGARATCALTVKAATVKVNRATLSLYEGRSQPLVATVTPADAPNSQVQFVSSNKKVASVDADGVVTGTSPGTAVITAKLKNGSKAVCTVRVAAASIRFPKATGEAYLDREIALPYTLTPDSAALTITWKSSNPSVATVDGQGHVKGLRKGKTVVTAHLKSGSTASVTLTVKEVGVALSSRALTLYMDQTKELTVAETGNTGVRPEFDVALSDPSVAAYEGGAVRPLKVGKTIITFTHPNGSSASCQVEVLDYDVYSVVLSVSAASVMPGETLQLQSTVLHALAPDKSLAWTSSNPAVATVDGSGQVTGVKKGKCTITATSVNGVKASCTIQVGSGLRRALVISEFTSPSMNKYMPVSAHAGAIALGALKTRGYTAPAVCISPTKAQLLSKIVSYGAASGPHDVTAIYLTTHGINYEGAYYLSLPGWYEQIGNMQYAISSSELVNAISGIKGHVLLVLNTCNSGGFLREQSSVLSGMNVTVICSSQWGVSSGWLNTGVSTSSYDFLSAGFAQAMGCNMESARLASMPADKNRDGKLTAAEVTQYNRQYTAALAKQFFGTAYFVGDEVSPQTPQILVTDPNQILFEP